MRDTRAKRKNPKKQKTKRKKQNKIEQNKHEQTEKMLHDYNWKNMNNNSRLSIYKTELNWVCFKAQT